MKRLACPKVQCFYVFVTHGFVAIKKQAVMRPAFQCIQKGFIKYGKPQFFG